jgi:hypothetical protein
MTLQFLPVILCFSHMLIVATVKLQRQLTYALRNNEETEEDIDCSVTDTPYNKSTTIRTIILSFDC